MLCLLYPPPPYIFLSVEKRAINQLITYLFSLKWKKVQCHNRHYFSFDFQSNQKECCLPMEKTTKINGTDLVSMIALIIRKPYLSLCHIKLQRGYTADLAAHASKYSPADTTHRSDFSTDCSAAVLWQHHINEPAEVRHSMWFAKFNPVPQTSPTLHNSSSSSTSCVCRKAVLRKDFVP